MHRGRILSGVGRRGAWFGLLKVILSLFILVYAATITTNTTIYHAETGGAIKVTNDLKAMDKGFSKASSNATATGTSCGSPVNFGPTQGTANTAITAGDIVYDIQVNTTALSVGSTCYTVTFTITPDGGSPTSSSVYISTLPAVVPDQVIDCQFDIGTSLPTSPYSFRVTIQ